MAIAWNNWAPSLCSTTLMCQDPSGHLPGTCAKAPLPIRSFVGITVAQNRGYSWASFKGPPTEILLDSFSGIVPLPSPRPTSKEQKVQRMGLRLNTRTQPMDKELLFPLKHSCLYKARGGGGKSKLWYHGENGENMWIEFKINIWVFNKMSVLW